MCPTSIPTGADSSGRWPSVQFSLSIHLRLLSCSATPPALHWWLVPAWPGSSSRELVLWEHQSQRRRWKCVTLPFVY